MLVCSVRQMGLNIGPLVTHAAKQWITLACAIESAPIGALVLSIDQLICNIHALCTQMAKAGFLISLRGPFGRLIYRHVGESIAVNVAKVRSNISRPTSCARVRASDRATVAVDGFVAVRIFCETDAARAYGRLCMTLARWIPKEGKEGASDCTVPPQRLSKKHGLSWRPDAIARRLKCLEGCPWWVRRPGGSADGHPASCRSSQPHCRYPRCLAFASDSALAAYMTAPHCLETIHGRLAPRPICPRLTRTRTRTTEENYQCVCIYVAQRA